MDRLKEYEMEEEKYQEDRKHGGANVRDEDEEENGDMFKEGEMIFFGEKKKDNMSIMIDLAKEKELNSWKENQVYEEVE